MPSHPAAIMMLPCCLASIVVFATTLHHSMHVAKGRLCLIEFFETYEFSYVSGTSHYRRVESNGEYVMQTRS